MRDFLRYILKLLAPYKSAIVWCTFLAFAAAGLNMLGPILLGRAVDAAQGTAAAAMVAVGVFGWLATQHAVGRLQNYLGKRGRLIAFEAVSADKFAAVDALLRKPLSFHYGRKSGDVTERLTRLEESAMGVIEGVIFDLVPAGLTVLAALAYLAFLDWKVGLLLAVSVAGFIGHKLHKFPIILPLQRAWRAASHAVNSAAWDAVHNVLIVKSTGAEEAVSARLAEGRRKMLDAVDVDARVDEGMFNRENLISYGGSALTLLVALLNVRAGAFTFGEFTAVSAYTFTIFGYVRYLQWQIRGLMRASATHQDVREMLDVPAEDFAGGRAVDLEGGVEFRGVRFRYRDDVPVIEDVSFTARPGERVAVVGESGKARRRSWT